MKNLRGFTIIELLVVIVIISILTTISVIAYNGIQERAAAAKASAVVDTYVKVLEMYYIDHGGYPEMGEFGVCLGTIDNYPATEHLSEGKCDTVGSYVNETFNQAISPYLSSMVDGSLPVVVEDYQGQNLYRRGIFYERYSYAGYAILIYYLSGNVVSLCRGGTGDVITDSSGNTITNCYIRLGSNED